MISILLIYRIFKLLIKLSFSIRIPVNEIKKELTKHDLQVMSNGIIDAYDNTSSEC